MIGIIGGYGDIGHNVVETLYGLGHRDLLVGGRYKRETFQRYEGVLFQAVNLCEECTIKEFVNKCSVVINCTGIKEDMTEKLLKEIQRQKCSYIDPQFNRYIQRFDAVNDNIFIEGVGSMPGLSGALPVFLKSKFQKIKGIKLYYLGNGIFSRRSAKDFLDGINFSDNLSMVKYEKGKLLYNNVKGNEFLPILNKHCMLLPYFDREAQEVCEFLKLEYAEFYTAIENNLTYRVLMKARDNYKNNPQQTIEDLCNASMIDYDRNSVCGFIVTAEGEVDRVKKNYTVILKAKDASSLTGEILAIMADLLTSTNRRPSKNILSMWEYQVIDKSLIERINQSSNIYMQFYENSIKDLKSMEEGEI